MENKINQELLEINNEISEINNETSENKYTQSAKRRV